MKIKGNLSRFKAVVGVDQTGAKGAKGQARPLPAALLFPKKGTWVLKAPLSLNDFTKKGIEQMIEHKDGRVPWKDVLVVADCVLGLPKKIVGRASPLKILRQAMIGAGQKSEIGLKAGEVFFEEHFKGSRHLNDLEVLREQEKFLGCLSVFKNKPFQRNVQTGTYRIWSDLGKEKDFLNFNIWPYEKNQNKAFLCEGYPAYAKKILNNFTEDQIKGVELVEKLSPDHKDAAALAVLGALFFDPSGEIKDQQEGQILKI